MANDTHSVITLLSQPLRPSDLAAFQRMRELLLIEDAKLASMLKILEFLYVVFCFSPHNKTVANTEVEAIGDVHLRGFLCPSVECGDGIPCICIEEAGK